jgi:hypothetical protein
MRANCPSCREFNEAPKRGLVTSFKDADGLVHAIPDMWLAGRSTALAKSYGLSAVESHLAACRQWAQHCATERTIRFTEGM